MTFEDATAGVKVFNAIVAGVAHGLAPVAFLYARGAWLEARRVRRLLEDAARPVANPLAAAHGVAMMTRPPGPPA